MGRFKKILIGFAIFLAVVGIAGFLVIPPVVKPILMEKLSEALHREVTVEKVSVNPYTLSAGVSGLVVKERSGAATFLSLDSVEVNAEGLASLLQRAVILKKIRIVKPYVKIDRHDDGSYNFSDLIPPEEKDKEKKPPPRFSFNNIEVVNGSADVWDGPEKTAHKVREMHLSIPFISNVEYYVGDYVEPRFAAQINDDPFVLEGKTKPFADSLETLFDVEISGLDIPHYMNYVPIKTNFTVASAALDVKAQISFIRYKDKPPVLKVSGNVELRDLALDDLQGRRVLQYPSLAVAMASIEPLVPKIHLSSVRLQSPEILIRRTQDGELIHPKPLARVAAEVDRREQKPISVRVDEARIEGGRMTFIDEFPAEPVKITVAPLNLRAEKISTDKGSTGSVDLALTVNQKGTVSVKGPVSIDPLSAEMDVDVKNIAIAAFQPYFTDKVRINVTGGAVTTSGRFSLNQDSKKAPSARYAGKILVSGFSSVDKAHANDFLKWKSLFFDQLTVGYNPVFADVRGISLADFYVRLIINPDGTRNVQQILGKEAAEGEARPAEGGDDTAQKGKGAAEPEKKAPPEKAEDIVPPNIKVGKVTLQGGTIDFTDQFIKPSYSAKMLNMTGAVTGLSSEEITRANVELRGNLGRGSPIEIKGKVNPLIKDLFADLELIFRDIEMSPMTPYTNKYLGYPIIKGKLTFDVKYLIEGRKLSAQNKVFLDQLTFGEKVESPDAIKAPVPLAVTLLKDRQGQIKLDIPLSGSLDDPKFSVWPIIWQIILNLITKAVTAPFALLGSLFGGGEELGYVEFDYGSSDILEAGQKKIEILSKALADRPAVKLDVEGYVDAEKDTEGLKRAAFDQKIKAQKLNELARKGRPTGEVDDIEISPQEYEKYLTLAYKAEKFPKPRNIIGIAKDLPVPEMEKLMLTHIPVTDSDLRQLASDRAESVKDAILEMQATVADRVFMVEPKSLAPGGKENVRASRVEFKLK